MKGNFISVLILIGILSGASFAQTAPPNTPEAGPTPKPVVKRRTFDQFDLSNGVTVRASGSSVAGYGVAKTGVVELVDERTYDGVRRLVEYAKQMGADYRSAATGPNFRPDDWEPLSVLNRQLNATYRITEMFHQGLLDEKPLEDPLNILLLEECQTTLQEAGSVAAISGGWSKNETMLAKMAAKYVTEETPGIDTRRAVLLGMLTRLNTNFAQLLAQISVKKH